MILCFPAFPLGFPGPWRAKLYGGTCAPCSEAALRVYIFAKNKGLRRRNGINIYIPTIVTSTLGRADVTVILMGEDAVDVIDSL